jgi:hypothetical protein
MIPAKDARAPSSVVALKRIETQAPASPCAFKKAASPSMKTAGGSKLSIA